MTTGLKKNLKNAVKTAVTLAKEAEIIAGIGRIIGSTLNIDEVYERFADEAEKLIPFDRVAINLINTKDPTIIASYESGLNIPGRRIGNIHPLKNSFNELILKMRAAQRLHPASFRELESQFPQMAVLYRVGLRSIMGAPLISGNRVISTLQFRSKKPNAYNDHYCRLAERIANQIAGAIANAQLFLERERTEKALRESERQLHLLSSHLLTAQETERKRISMELHDELGQALMLLKLRISFVENRLPKTQRGLRESPCPNFGVHYRICGTLISKPSARKSPTPRSFSTSSMWSPNSAGSSTRSATANTARLLRRTKRSLKEPNISY
jgi:hypothetical protein